MVVVGTSEDVKFGGDKDGRFVRGEVRNGVITKEKSVSIKFPDSGYIGVCSGPLSVVFLGVVEGEGNVGVSVTLCVTTELDDISGILLSSY